MRIAIIGGGASGLTCAISIARKAKEFKLNIEVSVFEAKDKTGKKLLATGNGRCNLMNRNQGDFYFDNNGFSAFALKKYDVISNLDFFSSLGLYTRTDEEGRIYPLSNQASSVLDCFRFACEDLKIKTLTDYTVDSIRFQNGKFIINNKLNFDKVILACGGKAAVKNFNGYELLTQVGHKVTHIRPSLTKFEVDDKKTVKQLKGIKQKGEFSLFNAGELVCKEKGELLFTDYGLSGIAVMQLSAYAVRCGKELTVSADFVSELSYNELVEAIKIYAASNTSLKNENLLSGFVQKRLGEIVIKNCGLNLIDRAADLTENQIRIIAKNLKKFRFRITAIRGFDDAQVTAGGADTSLFNNKTMESKKIKGLYCIGEILDVDGLCGGYNLHWAWSSARLCGDSIVN